MAGNRDRQTVVRAPARDAAVAERVGVVDIGSNTVRLVVYETPTRLPLPIFNEKAQCGLGREVGRTGKLTPDGIERCQLTVRLGERFGFTSEQGLMTVFKHGNPPPG